jgi:hypothetical protein
LDGLTKPPEEQGAVDPSQMGMPQGMAEAGAPAMAPGMPPPGIPAQGGMPPQGAPDGLGGPGYGLIPRSSLKNVIRHLRKPGEPIGKTSSYSQFSSPVNLLNSSGIPPTVGGVPSPDKSQYSNIPNLGGLNRGAGGKVNTDIPLRKTTDVGSNILSRSMSIQKKSK